MSNTHEPRRVVVTGMGVASPLGNTIDDFWSNIKAGTIGYGPITIFDPADLYITIAGQVENFEPRDYLDSKQMLLGERYTHFAGVAAQEAVKMSGVEIPVPNGRRVASIVGSGAGGLGTLEDAYRALFIHNKRATHPLTLLRTIGSSAAAHVGIEYGIKGPTFGTVSACSTAAHAIGLSFDMIRSGAVDMAVAGASEAAVNYGSMRAWQAMRVLSPEACRPFSKTRNGTVLSEGAGILVLESYENAKERGAPILAEMMGFGMTADAADMVNPSVEGPADAMKDALTQAGLGTSDIDYINAHGTATAVNDSNETRAIREVFGKDADDLAVSSTKSMHGHLLGAGGGVEAVACIKAIQENILPPTMNYEEADPECDLDYVPNEARKSEVNYAMSNSLAFGGLNTVIVFGPAPD